MKNYLLKPTKSSDADAEKPLVSESSPARGAPNPAPDLPCIVGIDLHPDIFDGVILKQQKKASDARVVKRFREQPVGDIVAWAKKNLSTDEHLLVIEATTNTFDTATQLIDAGFCCVVVDSAQTEKVAEAFIDDDQLAAERIGRCYLTGYAKVVWVPDAKTRERRDLLHAYDSAVTAHVRATNTLKSLLTSHNVRPGNRNLHLTQNRQWVEKQLVGKLGPVQEVIFEQAYESLQMTKANRDRFYQMICREMLENKSMLKCLRVVGIGMVNAFAVVAIVGDVTRFANAKKLVSYFGLNPGRKKSGRGKDVKKPVGNRGRRDMRAVLTQAAQSVLRKSTSKNPLNRWGFRLFARTGKRNVAIIAIARKMTHALYHILSGRASDLVEQRKPMERKFYKLSGHLKKEGREAMGLPGKASEFAAYLFEKVGWVDEWDSASCSEAEAAQIGGSSA